MSADDYKLLLKEVYDMSTDDYKIFAERSL